MKAQRELNSKKRIGLTILYIGTILILLNIFYKHTVGNDTGVTHLNNKSVNPVSWDDKTDVDILIPLSEAYTLANMTARLSAEKKPTSHVNTAITEVLSVNNTYQGITVWIMHQTTNNKNAESINNLMHFRKNDVNTVYAPVPEKQMHKTMYKHWQHLKSSNSEAVYLDKNGIVHLMAPVKIDDAIIGLVSIELDAQASEGIRL